MRIMRQIYETEEAAGQCEQKHSAIVSVIPCLYEDWHEEGSIPIQIMVKYENGRELFYSAL